jgi:hypothetical protein
MTRLIASALVVVLAMAAGRVDVISAGRFAQNTGVIAGTATVDGKPLPLVRLRLRNVDNETIVATTRADREGKYSFSDLAPANYVVETVSDNDVLLGVSAPVALSSGAMAASNVRVDATATAVAAAGVAVAAGAGGAAAAAAGGGALAAVGGSLGAVVIAGGVIAAAATIAANTDASPSR